MINAVVAQWQSTRFVGGLMQVQVRADSTMFRVTRRIRDAVSGVVTPQVDGARWHALSAVSENRRGSARPAMPDLSSRRVANPAVTHLTRVRGRMDRQRNSTPPHAGSTPAERAIYEQEGAMSAGRNRHSRDGTRKLQRKKAIERKIAKRQARRKRAREQFELKMAYKGKRVRSA